MTVDYDKHKSIIVEKERKIHKPYVGYISPSGDLLDFNTKENNNLHDDWDNIVAESFLKFVSFVVESEGKEERIIRGISGENKTFDEFINELDREIASKTNGNKMFDFRKRLLQCLKKAYLNKSFFDSIGREISVIDEDTFRSRKNNIVDFKEEYLNYLKSELMNEFKDIAIMYLGYDALERFMPNGHIIEVPNGKGIETYFDKTPRIITTSNPDTTEKYFNHLIMDWNIHKVPRYYYNEKEHKYEVESIVKSFYDSSESVDLQNEIKSIKKLVPLKDRYKYFRN